MKPNEVIISGATKIHVDGEKLDWLFDRYPNFKKRLRIIIDKELDRYLKKPFHGATRNFIIQEIKEQITFHNPNFEESKRSEVKEVKKDQEIKAIFGVLGQVQHLYEIQPFFYDKSGMFFTWDDENKKYILSDEVDLLNHISKIGVDTISSKIKSEIINALKQEGRRRVPKDAPRTWVQFKDTIYDFKTEEEFEATPEYFITNPIPYNLGENGETPMIDGLFIDWVGEDYKETLEQITAYSISSHQFMQRLIALVGGGSNGKGTYLKLLVKFLGKENTASSEIKELSGNQFETAVIYKKLLCVAGEVSYDDLKNTNQLKKLGGEDAIRYCFKGKTPFTEDSPTTLISATNSLPRTPDKTIGFYRKFLIVDFPNQFTEIKEGLIDKIPEKEFENLAYKCLRILKGLYKNQKFTNEGSFEDRMQRYEERSNPIMRFVDLGCEEITGMNLVLREFVNAFNEYAKENHLRIMSVRQVSKLLKEEGFDLGQRKKDNETNSKQVILNLMLKTIKTNETNEGSTNIPPSKSSLGSIGSIGFNGFGDENG